MKCLSLKQPWLHAIFHLGKRVENRTWIPPASILGTRIALHASKSMDVAGYRAIYNICGATVPHDLPYGAIVGTAVVTDCVSEDEVLARMVPLEDKWFFGPYGWLLSDPVLLRAPALCIGHQGLWTVPSEIESVIRSELRHVAHQVGGVD